MEIDGPPLAEPAGPLEQLLRRGLAADPDGVAIESVYRRLTWAQLEQESARLAAGYLSIGLEPGDRLASLMPNRVALLVHYLACFKAGLVATPLNYRYTAREIDHALSVIDGVRTGRPCRAGRGHRGLEARRLPAARHRRVPRRAGRKGAGFDAGPAPMKGDDNWPGWHHRFDDLLTAEPHAPGPAIRP